MRTVGYVRFHGMWRSLVSAPALGAGGRRFESGHPDQVRAYVDLDEAQSWEPTWEPCAAVPCVADPRTTMRYDRARKNLDRHPNYILAAYMAPGT